MSDLNQIALVTGASSGLGRDMALKLGAKGYTVGLIGRNKPRLKAVAQEIPKSQVYICDLSDLKQIDQTVEQIKSDSDSLSLLINNAGVFQRGSFNNTTIETWKNQWSTNLLGPIYLTQKLYPLLKKAKSSQVINISSTLGFMTVPDTSAYSAVKAAMIQWTKNLALEWASDKIQVNCICPGLIQTPIHNFTPDQDLSTFDQMQPLKRMGQPTDITEAVEYLVHTKWVTGTNLIVDGGISLG